jgi:uncharacterized protein (DUF305 family)
LVDVADETTEAAVERGRRPRSTVVLVAVIAVGVLVIAGAVGWLARGGGSSTSAPSTSSVDVGFARDMSTHHVQAITMAGYERDNTTNPALKVLAADIETQQQFQIGEMQGWLDNWGLTVENPGRRMLWMGPEHARHVVNGLMPGMATPAQMRQLQSMHGTALDIFFLQLMVHHHQGGVVMARFAAAHAQLAYVRNLAQAMVAAQSGEIVQMEQLLRQLGGSPLPPPQT